MNLAGIVGVVLSVPSAFILAIILLGLWHAQASLSRNGISGPIRLDKPAIAIIGGWVIVLAVGLGLIIWALQ